MKHLVYFLTCTVFTASLAFGQSTIKNDISLFGGVGISNSGDTFSGEQPEDSMFSFNPGLRVRFHDLMFTESFFSIDVGYLEQGYVTRVTAADYLVWRSYSYLNFNALLAKKVDIAYFGGGIFFASALDAWWISEIDSSSVTHNSNFGINLEAGLQVLPYATIGAKYHKSFSSVANSTDIKFWALYVTFTVKLIEF
jgi:hypothetical protein